MYTIYFEYEGDVVDFVDHTENDEPVWMAAGFDLLPQEGRVASFVGEEVWYAIETIEKNRTYYEQVHGESATQRVLDFLNDLDNKCENHPDAVVHVDY